jgi:ABC-2 type transport system ATP-binding protein
MSMVVMNGVGKRFPGQGTPALRDINLQVGRGTVVGLVGANGAGKSTLLRLLAGVLAPTEGEILIDDQAVHETPWGARTVGYLPERVGVYPTLTVIDDLDFFGRCYDLPPALRRQIGDELLALFGLGDLAHQLGRQLTRGQRQRLGLARTLVHDPPLLLLDDPAAGLDPRGRLELVSLLQELVSMGKTILIAGDVLAELGEICDEVLLLERGRAAARGTPSALSSTVPKALWRVQVLSDGPHAEDALRAYPGVEGLTSRNGRSGTSSHWLDFVLEDDPERTAGLLEHLATSHVRVASLERASAPLEDAYLTYTAEGQ